MSEHAILAPSSAEQWGHCAGSVKAQADFPSLESEQTREGTAAHWVVSEALEVYKRGIKPHCVSYEGQKAPNGVVIDDRAVEGAQIMVDDVINTHQKFRNHSVCELLIEERVQMPQIHPSAVWGTLDAAIYSGQYLYIWDYKHGYRDCKAENNLQLINYIAGLINKYQIHGIQDQNTTVVARIVQPFSYSAQGPIKQWVFKLSDLRGHLNHLNAKATEALSDNPTLSSGRWCRDCKAVGKCSTARMWGYNFVDMVNEPYEMDKMTGHDLAIERSILQDGVIVAKSRLEAIEDELTYRIKAGEKDSNLSLEQSQGREKWTIPNDQVILLAGQLGVDAKKSAVKTPKQTRDSAPKEVRPILEKVMANVVQRAAGKLKLVPTSDTKSARAFKKRDDV